ncbi:hypothetical protein PoB_000244700 [Plakobranchus ocellatus]|uniref:Uncharacterized protein n=1 Tax=Plakobranchus ocellatus TaxID=259542 RepID=A0AAV3Y0G2_9GAST|nr:hypothetical protein PoB_000244700 [Plakobranchus ocellatus]
MAVSSSDGQTCQINDKTRDEQEVNTYGTSGQGNGARQVKGSEDAVLSSNTDSDITGKCQTYTDPNQTVTVETSNIASTENMKDSDPANDLCDSDEDVNVTDDENMADASQTFDRSEPHAMKSDRRKDEIISRDGSECDKRESDSAKSSKDPSPEGRTCFPNRSRPEVMETKRVNSPNSLHASSYPHLQQKHVNMEKFHEDVLRHHYQDEIFRGFAPHHPHLLPPEERLLLNHNRMPLSVLQLQQQQQQQQHLQQNSYLDVLYRRHLESVYHNLRAQGLPASPPPPPSSGSPQVSDHSLLFSRRNGSPESMWEFRRRQNHLMMREDAVEDRFRSSETDTSMSMKIAEREDHVAGQSPPPDNSKHSQIFENSEAEGSPRSSHKATHDVSESPFRRKRLSASPSEVENLDKCPKTIISGSTTSSPKPSPLVPPTLSATSTLENQINQSLQPPALSLFSSKPSLLIPPTTTSPTAARDTSYNIPYRPWGPPIPFMKNPQSLWKDTEDQDDDLDVEVDVTKDLQCERLSMKARGDGDGPGPVGRCGEDGGAYYDGLEQDERSAESPDHSSSPPGSPDKFKHGRFVSQHSV